MKSLLLYLSLCLLPMLCVSQVQSTTVKLLDLSVHPSAEVDSVTGLPLDTSIISYNLDFKVNAAADASQARILFGTTQNSGDILDFIATFTLVAGQYYLNYNGNSNIVTGYNARIKVGLTGTQEAAFNYITLYLLDNQGQETNRLYFVK